MTDGLTEIADGVAAVGGTETWKKFESDGIENTCLPQALPDLDAAFETILFALPAGLSSDQAALIVGVDGTSFNILATQRELQDDPRIQKLYELLISPEAARFKQDAWGEPVLPVSDCKPLQLWLLPQRVSQGRSARVTSGIAR